MSKITTANCVDAIIAESVKSLSKTVSEFAPKWKRLHKSGRAGGIITRIFSSKQAPWVKAVVQELPGGKLDVKFAQRNIWECYYEEEVDWEAMEDGLNHPEISALPGPRPEDFVFGVSYEEHWNGNFAVFVVLCPKLNSNWDQELGYSVGELLPKANSNFEIDEVSESTFVLDYDDVETAKSAMLALGFAHDPKMDGELGC